MVRGSAVFCAFRGDFGLDRAYGCDRKQSAKVKGALRITKNSGNGGFCLYIFGLRFLNPQE
jgi:hypothetical protein